MKGGLRTALFCAFIFGFTPYITAQDTLRILFYDVENLFDTIDDPETFDEDFTPSGKLEYDDTRYQTKLANLAKVIEASYGHADPDIIGLCEVENETVVSALVEKTGKSYQIVHRQSRDGRGIDNALVYRSSRFDLLASGTINVDLGEEERPTRDILWVALKEAATNELFVVMVNHWPSRYGGAEESEWKRIKASEALVSEVEQLTQKYPTAYLIAMGDFNDYPTNESLLRLSRCEPGPCLENMMLESHKAGNGSHAYKGEWGFLDQILVNGRIYDANGSYRSHPDFAGTVKEPWMLYHNEKDGDDFPSRTYGGTRYFGGYSDHLPVYLFFVPN